MVLSKFEVRESKNSKFIKGRKASGLLSRNKGTFITNFLQQVLNKLTQGTK